ncbi:LysE family translocator [Congregibacter litoralis]|uniref:Putative threonine efflux protein n=1 Tax=Congregibacter litoralis KT71 TaxID=314285 RepID=A4A713_9GAMM|nr:LysE family translocator [Congregibacter litoralis]EAQ98082.1 putative threonine efflux protein [Congregibacter litoralis KT71]
MIDVTKLLLFIPTMLLISATPGMCMTLAMTLGMTVGLRRTAWMMAGEVTGVALVSTLSGLGVASLMLRYPAAFTVFKLAGGAYMVWLGIQLWRSRGAMAISADDMDSTAVPPGRMLALQGFVTAIANPKGWAFFMALLPPFMLTTHGAINAHNGAILLIILLSELLCMTLYATGGKALRRLLKQRSNVAVLNRIAGTLMIVVGLWLAIS